MRKNKGILDLYTRRKIYEAIVNNPGIHFRKLSRYTNIPFTTLSYHLKIMKRYGLVKEENHINYSHYYVCNGVARREKKALNLLRKKTKCHIIMCFLFSYCATLTDISKELELHPNTVNFHLKKMLKLGVIEPAEICEKGVLIFNDSPPLYVARKPVCNEIIYKLCDPLVFYRALIVYKKSISDDLISQSYIDCLHSNRIWPPPKKLNTFNSAIDSVEEVFKEIIPCPFCA
jgi:DNA-binding Lrp family transcriptional regulator